jgi:lysophospholipase L1-like esterase
VRILVLGDSYAFGRGLPEEQANPRRLEEMARERYPLASIEIVNGAIPGYCVYQQRAMLERLLAEIKINVVISSFSLANDLAGELQVSRAIARYSEGSSYHPRGLTYLFSEFWRRSYFLTWFNKRTHALQVILTKMGDEALQRLTESLEDLISTCRQRDIPLLLVVLPRRIEICDNGIRAKIAELATDRARKWCKEIAGQHGIPVLDVSDVLKNARNAGPVYLDSDPHWTAEGHRAVAQAILNELPSAWLTSVYTKGEDGNSHDRRH